MRSSLVKSGQGQAHNLCAEPGFPTEQEKDNLIVQADSLLEEEAL